MILWVHSGTSAWRRSSGTNMHIVPVCAAVYITQLVDASNFASTIVATQQNSECHWKKSALLWCHKELSSYENTVHPQPVLRCGSFDNISILQTKGYICSPLKISRHNNISSETKLVWSLVGAFDMKFFWHLSMCKKQTGVQGVVKGASPSGRGRGNQRGLTTTAAAYLSLTPAPDFTAGMQRWDASLLVFTERAVVTVLETTWQNGGGFSCSSRYCSRGAQRDVLLPGRTEPARRSVQMVGARVPRVALRYCFQVRFSFFWACSVACSHAALC